MDSKVPAAHTASVQRHQSVKNLRESPSVPNSSTARNAAIAFILFFVAHFALLVGVTTLLRRSALCAGGTANARARNALANAQPDASAAGKAVDRIVDPDFRGCAAGLALPECAVRIAGDRSNVFLRPCAVRGARARDRRRVARLFQPDGVRAIADRNAGYFCAGIRPVRDRCVHAWLPETATAAVVRSRRPRFRSFDCL
jgi:hypothetical protein